MGTGAATEWPKKKMLTQCVVECSDTHCPLSAVQKQKFASKYFKSNRGVILNYNILVIVSVPFLHCGYISDAVHELTVSLSDVLSPLLSGCLSVSCGALF